MTGYRWIVAISTRAFGEADPDRLNVAKHKREGESLIDTSHPRRTAHPLPFAYAMTEQKLLWTSTGAKQRLYRKVRRTNTHS